jgi:hypothetical protein
MPLGQSSARFIAQQGTMKKCRWFQIQRPVKQDLPRRAHQQVFTAYHLGDLHGRVVEYTGELIRRNVVMPPDDKITKMPAGDELLWPKIPVGERNNFTVRNAKTPIRWT